MTQLRRTILPITRSCSAKKKLPTSAWRRSTSSTRRARLRRRTATFSSPVVAAAVDAVVVAAADAVAVAADAVVALAWAGAALPGAHAAGAKRGHLPRLININNYGRVRHRRPGQCMCASGVIAAPMPASRSRPNSRFTERHPHAARTKGHSRSRKTPAFAGRRCQEASCAKR